MFFNFDHWMSSNASNLSLQYLRTKMSKTKPPTHIRFPRKGLVGSLLMVCYWVICAREVEFVKYKYSREPANK